MKWYKRITASQFENEFRNSIINSESMYSLFLILIFKNILKIKL